MTLWRCKRCTTRFAVGLHCCPQCTGTDVEEDTEMPKISKHGGATNAAEAGSPPVSASAGLVEGEFVPGERSDDAPEPVLVGGFLPPTGDEVELEPLEGSEQPSAGNSSETSPEKPPTNDEPNEADPPKPARTTASRSAKGRKGSSTARSTGGSGRGTRG